MDDMSDTLIKHREIKFFPLHPDPNQAQSATLLLGDADGILGMRPASPVLLHVSYDVAQITLRIIEEALVELGFHLDNSLLLRLRRALYYYTEETQRTNLGCPADDEHTRKVFISRYQQRPHGCRDGRPPHWRKYW